MSREIKFRAWDSEINKMVYDGDLWLPQSTIKLHSLYRADKSNCYPVSVTNKGIHSTRKLSNSCVYVEVHDDTGKPKSRTFYEEWESESLTSGFLLMESTGLKDKNGKEIYEDDITKNENGEIRLVKWRDYGFKLIPIYGAIGILTFAGGRKRENNNKQIEVIGNVYESKELLEQVGR